MSRLDADAESEALLAEEREEIKRRMQEALQEELDKPAMPRRQSSASSEASNPGSSFFKRRTSSATSVPKAATNGASASGAGRQQAKKRNWESHDVYRAIEKKDLTTLFEIRDSAFALLVQKTGSQTPLLYASRIGKSHREIAILLTGALSRFVNQLPDDVRLQTPQMQSLIRAVRANLKLAINESLTSNQTELISSYLQIIIMSEGEKWILEQTQNVALALRLPGKEGKPVQTAMNAVKNFATRELRTLEKGNAVASVEDYLANATNDLVIMALWSSVTDKMGGKLLPSYQFGRDERIFKSFADNIDAASKKGDYIMKLGKHVRQQIQGTIDVMNTARATGHAEKSRALAELLDL